MSCRDICLQSVCPVRKCRVVSRYLPTFSVSREDISGNDTDRNGHGPLHPQHKEWISSLLIAASTEAAVDSPKLYEPVMSRCLVCPPRANQCADSIFDSWRTQMSCRVETLAYECVCKCLCCVARHFNTNRKCLTVLFPKNCLRTLGI